MNILFFSAIKPQRPTGGVLVIFRCVEILRAQGFNAYVVALPIAGLAENSGIEWFSSTAPIISWEQACQMAPEDCIHVLPEDFCMKWHEDTIKRNGQSLSLKGARLLVFAQNRYGTFRNFQADWPKIIPREKTLLGRENLLGALCVSPFEQAYWKTIYPDLKVWCKPNSVDTSLFKPASARSNIAAFIGKPLGKR